MLIKNYKQLATNKSKKQLLDIIQAGIQSVMPDKIMPAVLSYDKRKRILIVKGKNFKVGKGRIFVIGGGKAVGLMAETLENIIGANNITAGAVNCVSANYQTKKIKINKANHPMPDMAGVQGIKKILSLKSKHIINQNDLIICLISGGGSSLLPCPKDGITLKDKQIATKLLIESGAKIQEINAVRKHLSLIKGGQLAEFFMPAKIVSVIISDVVGNDLDTIASGITAPDKSTWADAYRVLQKYKLTNKIPKNVLKLIRHGLNFDVPETPKKLPNVHNFIVADNMRALKAMAEKAKQLKLKPKIITDKIVGQTGKTAIKLSKQIKTGKFKSEILIFGGETTPILPTKHGKGGRNQHFAAVTILAMKNFKRDWAMASIGSDGVDFIREAGGAVIDNQTLKKIEDKKIDVKKYIRRFDSYNLFKKTGNCLIKMDNTGTNVGDMVIYKLG